MSWTEWTDTNFRNLNLNELKVDEAFLNVSNAASQKYWLYWLTDECVKCPYKKLQDINENVDTLIKLDVARNLNLRLFSKNLGPYAFPNETDGKILRWSHQPDVGQFGVYDLKILSSEAIMWNEAKEPVNIYTSLIFVFSIVLAFYWSCKGANKLYTRSRRQREQNDDTNNSSPSHSTNDSEMQTKKRLKTIDIFRGIAIVLMIFVNSGGGHYWWIEHATWNGLHLADLVFPWFLFIMGVCIPMSVKSQFVRQVPKKDIVTKIVTRSIKLFLIGLFCNTIWGAAFETIRIPGVLQRFAISYLVVSLMQVAFYSNVISASTRIEQLFIDFKVLWKHWIAITVMMVIYLFTIFEVAVPGCEKGYNGPGGIHDYLQHQNCTGGITGYIDRVILGKQHLYQHARITRLYDSLVFDPEGIYGSVTTILQVFLGVQCGTIMMSFPTPRDRLRRWLGWSGALMALTLVLTLFSWDDGIIPINKNLWSLSFVSVTVSLAFAMFSLIYYVADLMNYFEDFWKIFLYPGMNAIILYVGHSILHSMWPFHFSLGTMNTHFILTLENCYTVAIWILVSFYLHHKQIFFNL